MKSENILLQKQTEEQLSLNKILKNEVEQMKREMHNYLEESKNFKQFEQMISKQIEKLIENSETRDLENNNRINKLEQQLQEIEMELQKKNEEVNFMKSQNTTVAYKPNFATENNFYPQQQNKNYHNAPLYNKPQTSYNNNNNNKQYQFNRQQSNNQEQQQQQQWNFPQSQINDSNANPFLNNTTESIYLVQHQGTFLANHNQQITPFNTMNGQINNQYQGPLGKVQFNIIPETLEEDKYELLSQFLEVYSPYILNLELIYRGSRDGYTPQDFHDKCDGHEKTIVLIKSWEHDKVFGGYVSAKWVNCDEYLKDENAFIFSIDNKTKFKPKNADLALYLGLDYLLCFGNDLMIGENCNIDENSTCQFPKDYICNIPIDDNERTTYLTGGTKFQVDEMEVYKIQLSK